MGLSRSTFYDMPSAALKAAELLARIGTNCDEFECYGYRRVGAALRLLEKSHGCSPARIAAASVQR